MQCGKCGGEIGNSKYCGCGWKRPANVAFESNPTVPCAHHACTFTAKVKIQTKTGWANLCMKHYDQHYADEAHANLDKYGMAKLPDETTAEHVARMRAFVRNGVRKFANRRYEEAA